MSFPRRRPRSAFGLALAALLPALSFSLARAEEGPPHVDQTELTRMVAAGRGEEAFLQAFEAGDALTEHSFDAAAGVGANIGEGRRFTRFPRADLDGPSEWASHFPPREGGANATACIACHNAPFANGAGDVALNVVVDPAHTGDPALYLERNTLPLFALGVPQRLAEEISAALFAQRDAGVALACDTGAAQVDLAAKGVDYGVLRLFRTVATPCEVSMYTDGLQGIDADLVIKPFGWKGNQPTIRAFTRGAAHNELGLQATEIVGDLDGDFDGITGELTVGDMTALTLYMAALERPVSTLELAALGLTEMTPAEKTAIRSGEALFLAIGCADCHTPSMTLDDPVFSEPSRTPGFFDVRFPDGSDPAEAGLLAGMPVLFDLTADQPGNRIAGPDGPYHLGALPVGPDGFAKAHWYTDFRRHDMGPGLADPADPLGVGAEMFLTRSLAGVGDTGPWLHDGRATSLHEAVMLHGGDAAGVRDAYAALDAARQAEVTAFLESLVYYKEPAAAE